MVLADSLVVVMGFHSEVSDPLGSVDGRGQAATYVVVCTDPLGLTDVVSHHGPSTTTWGDNASVMDALPLLSVRVRGPPQPTRSLAAGTVSDPVAATKKVCYVRAISHGYMGG